jgi:hypothetical protein
MENVVFEVVTKAGFTLAAIVAFVAWANAGYPMFTIVRR